MTSVSPLQEVDTGVLSLMPSSLKMKVAFFQYEDVMERNTMLFSGCNQQFLNMLVVALREMYLVGWCRLNVSNPC